MILFSEFCLEHREQDEAAFLEQVTDPHFLIPTAIELQGAGWLGATISLPILDATLRATLPSELSLLAVRKRSTGNPFADMITIGRAKNNDLIVAHACVSWFHGYLRRTCGAAELAAPSSPRRSGEWLINDAGSTNGTLVDGLRAPPERKLRSGSIIELGGTILLEFVEPPELYARTRLQGAEHHALRTHAGVD